MTLGTDRKIVTLDADEFCDLATREGLQVEQGSDGYEYASRKTKDGWVLYRARRTIDWDSASVQTGTIGRPAAGANYASVTVPNGYRYLLLRAAYALTTDANVANRYPSIWVASNGATVDGWYISGTAIAASQASVSVSFIPGSGTGGVGTAGAGLSIGVGLPGIEMTAGTVFNFPVVNIQATDRADGSLTYVYKRVLL